MGVSALGEMYQETRGGGGIGGEARSAMLPVYGIVAVSTQYSQPAGLTYPA